MFRIYQNNKKNYIKYKNQFGGNNITIDNIKFNIKCKFNYKRYQHLHIISEDSSAIRNFIYYKSNSQGLWRYCRYDNDKYYYYKGASYTATTLVHLKLQVKINQIINTIREETDDSEIQNLFLLCSSPNSDTRNKIIFEDRIYNSSIFEGFYLSDVCFKSYEHLLNFLENIKEKNKKLNTYFITNNIRKSIEEINEFSNIPYNRDLRIKVVNSINSYLNNFLTCSCDEYITCIGYGNLFDKKTTYYYMDICAKSDQQNRKYRLYIQKYNYEGRDYYNNIIIVPVHSHINGDKINVYGLYSYYISSGIYTSKPYEYVIQSEAIITRTRAYVSDRKNRCNKRYCFIGDIVNRFWPLCNLEIKK